MKKILKSDDLMDIIMAYDVYVQHACSQGFIPETVADFYEKYYTFYSQRCNQKYVC